MTTKSVPSCKYDDIPGGLPEYTVPEGTNLESVAEDAIKQLNSLQEKDLVETVLWRDFLSFTDSIRTFNSSKNVYRILQQLSEQRKRSDFTLAGSTPRINAFGPSGWVDIDVNFSIQDEKLKGICAGTVSVTPDKNGNWQIWLLRTWLEYYDGHGNPDVLEATGEVSGRIDGKLESVYDVIIAGGGQGGLGLAGRVQALGLSYKLFDNRPEIGDSWNQRYDSLHWHTIKQYGNLPFGRTFADEKENLLPAKRIGAGYKAWSEKYSINAQPGTSVDKATWDEASQIWTVHTSGTKGNQQWQSKNLVLCIGPRAKSPVSPPWASPEKIMESGFKGKVIHAFHYHNCHDFAGKRGIVVGTANTGHDVALDMVRAGMDVTMVQRNHTFIFPGEWLVGYHSRDYNMEKPTEKADREQATLPYKIQREATKRATHGLIKAHPERFDAVEKAGFKLDRYGDLYTNLYVRAGGHYIDIGSVQRIIDGQIKMKGEPIHGLSEEGLKFEDGSEVKADLIVLATGFEPNFRKDAGQIIGAEIADQQEEFWGMDAEGELRGFAKLVGHPHLYYHGTEARLARFFGRFVALQLQKEKLGQPLKPYLEGK